MKKDERIELFRAEIDLVLDELESEMIKHPDWPEDKIHATARLIKEAGELLQAANDHEYRTKHQVCQQIVIDRMKLEAAQVGAMAIRILMNLQEA